MHQGVIYALLAAALFGASTPFAKALLGDVHPIVLAGLLYAGSGAGLAIVQVLRFSVIQRTEPIAWPSHEDWGWLAAAILSGGILGPVLLMFGLATTAASTTSLLLNLESAFTALLAWFVFRENFDRRIAAGMAAILAGGVVLSVGPGHIGGVSRGALLVAAACVCWAIDNNLTRKVSASDAILVAGLKGLVAGDQPLRRFGPRPCTAEPRLDCSGCGGRVLWLRAEPGVVRPRAKALRNSEDRRLFCDRTILRRIPGGAFLRRRCHGAVVHRRRTYGDRSLVASERTPRT